MNHSTPARVMAWKLKDIPGMVNLFKLFYPDPNQAQA